jgi:hypothetical protein
MTSAQCVTCHVEHRGHDALAAVSDTHCTQCHENLAGKTQSGKVIDPRLNSVRAFSLDAHPGFTPDVNQAVELAAAMQRNPSSPSSTQPTKAAAATPAAPAGAWVDATKLKFNHKYHLENPKIVRNDNCALCHVTAEPSSLAFAGGDPKHYDAGASAEAQAMFPHAADNPRPLKWSNAGDGKYMQPISFEKHCRSCHEGALTLPGGIVLPHERMEVVRDRLHNLPGAYVQMLAGMDEEERQKKMGGKAGGGGRPRRGGGGGGGGGGAAQVSESEWIAKQLQELAKKAKVADPEFKALEKRVGPLMKPLAGEKKASFHPSLVEYYVAKKLCAKCHEAEGEAMVVPVESMLVFQPTPSATPAGTPAAAGTGAGDDAAATPPAAEGSEGTEGTTEGTDGAGEKPKPKRRRRTGSGASDGSSDSGGRDIGGALRAASATPATDSAATSSADAGDDAEAPAEARVLLTAGGTRARPRRRSPGGSAATTTPPEPAAEQPAGDPAAAGAAQPAAAAATTPSVDASMLLRTVPTGIPDSPRRWFAHSQFDHAAHRNMNCKECHSKLGGLVRVPKPGGGGGFDFEPFMISQIDGLEDESLKQAMTAAAKETAEVLVPDIRWQIDVFENVGTADAAKYRRVGQRTRSCTDCHKPDASSQQRFAPAGCVTCHIYHDHSREVWPDGSPLAKPDNSLIEGIQWIQGSTGPAPAVAPAEASPTEEAPAEEAPAEEAPAGETPPATETPAEGTPAEGTPAEETTTTEEPPAEPAEAEGESSDTPPAEEPAAEPAAPEGDTPATEGDAR